MNTFSKRPSKKFFGKKKSEPSKKQEIIKSDEGNNETSNKDNVSKNFKDHKKPIGNRNGRLIIRNISFKCNEKQLQKEFEAFGKLEEVSIAKRPDGKMRGFAFIQFAETESAAKAIEEKNAKPILGRPVAVDWAVPKKKYDEFQKKSTAPEANVENGSIENNDNQNSNKPEINPVSKIGTDEKDDDDSDSGNDEDESVNGSDDEDESVDGSGGNADSNDEDMQSEDGESNSSENEEIDELGSDDENSEQPKKKMRKRNQTDDVDEGRTVFVRNIPFDLDEEELMEVFAKYGDVNYCKLVMDKLTDHPKGTAFIQFKQKEQAEECLDKCREDHEDGGLILEGRRIYANLALSRKKVQEINENKAKEKSMGKDKRNLYLAREGLIRAGTESAEGVSPADITKRMNLESRKRRLLKDLKMFISRTRLAVYNLPPNVNDNQLRKIFLNAVDDKKAYLTESRVMRDLKKTEGGKLGSSKGHGFVEFTDHEHALKALRILNNNPEIFTEVKRPIVEFSVENLEALKTKQMRLEKSRENNKLDRKTGFNKKRFRKENYDKRGNGNWSNTLNPTIKTGKFMGTASSKDEKRKNQPALPSHVGPKIRHKPRPKKEEKKSKEKAQKVKRKFTEDQNSTGVEPKRAKKNKANKNDKSFSNLVNQYQNKLKANLSEGVSKSKWFEDV